MVSEKSLLVSTLTRAMSVRICALAFCLILICCVTVNGKEMEVALWLKTSQAGMKYFSASFSEPYVKPVLTEIPLKVDDSDDDLPF